MIPASDITAWRQVAPWPADEQVEQDLVISRALVDVFSDEASANSLAFRGGTALHKLYAPQPTRYSEDIDLVQLKAGKIGPVVDSLRTRLDPWLGEPKRERSGKVFRLKYTFETTTAPTATRHLKVEINGREHFTVLGKRQREFSVQTRWFSGATDLVTYELEELLGTKMRALYQRRKGRDLFDLWFGLTTLEADPSKIVSCFSRYMEHENSSVSTSDFTTNLSEKLGFPDFIDDVTRLLVPTNTYDPREAHEIVQEQLIDELTAG